MAREQGGVNCFALLSRTNGCQAHLTGGPITASRRSERLDGLSLSRLTVVPRDNVWVHIKVAREHRAVWQERGLFVGFLPTYLPHLNIAQVLWRKLDYEWLRPEDYADTGTLRLAVWKALIAFGDSQTIAFSLFDNNSN